MAIPRFFDGDAAYITDRASFRSFRVAYFEHRVETDAVLSTLANVFQLRWLSQLYLSVITERALVDESSLEGAHAAVTGSDIESQLTNALDVIFNALPAPDDDHDDGGNASHGAHRQRVHQALAALAADPTVKRRLADLASILWDEPDARWEQWAARRFAATLGTALLEATDRLCTDVGARNLIMDFQIDDATEECTIWLSEPSLGGGGIVEEFARRYTDDPRRYFRLLEVALGPSDFEIVDSELTRILHLTASDAATTGFFARLRAATTGSGTTSALRDLVRHLAQRGVAVTHPVMAALNARVLRPGSTAQTDAALSTIVDDWRAREDRLGIEIDARVYAFVASASADLDRVFPTGARTPADARRLRFATVYGLLWPRGFLVRANALQSYNPYHPHPATDRALVLTSLDTTTPVVRLADPDWRGGLAEALLTTGAALLAAEPDRTRDLRKAATELQGLPVDAGYLMLFPRVTGFERENGEARVRFELREAFQ